jgi:hypothetical protein
MIDEKEFMLGIDFSMQKFLAIIKRETSPLKANLGGICLLQV